MRKCCAGECRSNYNKEVEKVCCFGFPPAEDKLRRKAWISALNVVIKESEIMIHIGVCIKHWPEGFWNLSEKKVKTYLSTLRQYLKPHLPCQDRLFLRIAEFQNWKSIMIHSGSQRRKRTKMQTNLKNGLKYWSTLRRKEVLLFLNLRTGFTWFALKVILLMWCSPLK